MPVAVKDDEPTAIVTCRYCGKENLPLIGISHFHKGGKNKRFFVLYEQDGFSTHKMRCPEWQKFLEAKKKHNGSDP